MSSSSSFLGYLLGAPLQCHVMGLQGNLQRLITENQLNREWEGDGVAATSVQILADGVPPCNAHVVVWTNVFPHLQSQDGGGVWPRSLAGNLYAWFKPSNKKSLDSHGTWWRPQTFLALELVLPLHLDRETICNITHYWIHPSSLPTSELNQSTREAV